MQHRSTAPSGDDWLGEPPTISDDMAASELFADVVVVGCGIAGVAAVRSAAEEGATVVAIEKAAGPQCRSSQFALMGGKLQERWGRTDVDPDLVIDHEMDEGSYFPKRAIWSKWAREGADVFDWYVEALEGIMIGDTHIDDVPDDTTAVLPMYHPQPEGYDWRTETHPCFPLSAWIIPAEQPGLDANMQKAVDTGNVTALWGHFAEKLVMEGGRCTGVYARDAETGGYVKVNAAKGVVLATGDYGSNAAMVAHFCPDVAANGIFCLWPNFDVEGNPTNTGDGLKLGVWAGALVQQHHAPMIHHMGGGNGVLMGTLGISPYLRLDLNGKRFMNEDCPGQQTENQIEHLKGKKCYMFWDADRNVIGGLYVAGNVQGDRFAVQYPIALKGASHSMTLYYGYVAGKNAVAEV